MTINVLRQVTISNQRLCRHEGAFFCFFLFFLSVIHCPMPTAAFEMSFLLPSTLEYAMLNQMRLTGSPLSVRTHTYAGTQGCELLNKGQSKAISPYETRVIIMVAPIVKTPHHTTHTAHHTNKGRSTIQRTVTQVIQISVLVHSIVSICRGKRA